MKIPISVENLIDRLVPEINCRVPIESLDVKLKRVMEGLSFSLSVVFPTGCLSWGKRLKWICALTDQGGRKGVLLFG